MLKGMTGFAQASCRWNEAQLHVEIRSLNHRFLECLVHCPDGFGAIEDFIKGLVKSRISRGRITVVVSVSNLHPKVIVDYNLADSYVRTLKQLNHRLKLDNHISLSQVINLEGVLKVQKTELTPQLTASVKASVEKALEKLLIMRQKEGRALTSDILRRTLLIEKEAQKIKSSIKELSRQKKGVLSEEEYSIFLKNTDIAEELTRISYHVKNFLATLRKSSASGKELDFIAQEIQREANTISAKAQSAQVSSSVVRIKSAIDQIREQVQNAE